MAKNEAVFTKDTDNKKITIVRAFKAPLQNVWNAWTQSDILDQWWAPKPWKAGTKSMDFREGGQWFYYMEGPDGERHYCLFNYKEIVPKKFYSGSDSFCDKDGNPTNEFPNMNWKVQFEEDGDETVVTAVVTYATVEDMETIIKMGFQEGFTMATNNLDEYFANK